MYRGCIHIRQEDVNEEFAYARLNIILPKDILWKLDSLKDASGLSSRGRTIQELIDAIWEIRRDADRIMDIAKDKKPMNDAEIMRSILPWLMDIVRRVFVFRE